VCVMRASIAHLEPATRISTPIFIASFGCMVHCSGDSAGQSPALFDSAAFSHRYALENDLIFAQLSAQGARDSKSPSRVTLPSHCHCLFENRLLSFVCRYWHGSLCCAKVFLLSEHASGCPRRLSLAARALGTSHGSRVRDMK
jgi:hypothetical protein